MKMVNFHIHQVLGTEANLLHALFHCEQGGLLGILGNSHHDSMKETASPFNNIEVAQGNRIKTTRINSKHECISVIEAIIIYPLSLLYQIQKLG